MIQDLKTAATRASSGWMVLVLILSIPPVAALCGILWQTPYPITEAVALFEDVARQPASHFFVPDTAYYRPLYHATLSLLWHQAGSLDASLAGIRLLHIIPIVVLVVLLVVQLRPRSFVDTVAALLAIAVLVGSSGFRDNLELPLAYTIIGMPALLAVWMLLNQSPALWRSVLVIALTLVAVGFKEQGLVLIPVVIAAWWTGAPGATRNVALALGASAVVYVVVRLMSRQTWSPFEQAVGLGFVELAPDEAAARYGAFPYGLYVYNSLGTMAQVLFAEPTRGLFRITQHLLSGRPAPWELVHLLSSTALTAVIVWWGVGALRQPRWSAEARLFVALIVVLLACGALSFNYSRDRLGGMATVLYAVAAYFAIRAAALRGLEAPPRALALTGAFLLALSALWHLRAIGTIEMARVTATRNQLEWHTLLPERRAEFADRPVYLGIMNSMVPQGTDPDGPWPPRYPGVVKGVLGLP